MKPLKHFLIWIMIPFIGFSQQYETMLRTDVLWEVVRWHWGGPGDYDEDYSHLTINTNLDTTINGFQYRGFSSNLLFREVLDSGKVYRRINDSTDYLEYDFRLKVGDYYSDIFFFGESEVDSLVKVVTNVDSIKIEGTWRTKITLEDTIGAMISEVWVEGIGSSDGPRGVGGDGWHVGEGLRCYRKKSSLDSSLYPSNAFCTPVGITAVEEKVNIRFFPNPVSDVLSVETAENFDQVRISNLSGALLLQSQTAQINLVDLPSGIYIVEVNRGEETLKREKVIKL